MVYIGSDLNRELDADPFYQKCCVTGKTPVQRHHNLQFGRKSVNRKFAILPLHKSVHDLANRKDVREILDWIMVNRMSEDELDEFSKAVSWRSRKRYLNKKFGVWQGRINSKDIRL